ncbi:hypothetical protein [Symbioplanes lichenis]|uniref:hypothetical protein n=1 Tax=Symbioplanes lichenis TaxID=1629072 RepID=UPI0027388C2D|nr:hypothetical protein [Actinoplanes lichenis]
MVEHKPCSAAGPSAADRAVADRVRPAMNGPRLGRDVQGGHVCCARVITATVQARGLSPRAAVIAVTTAITESALRNITRAVDHDSLGLFQQRPSMGWGTPAQLTDPVYATNAFLNAMIRKYPQGAWERGDIGAICQKVQVSAVPDAYAREVHDAQLLVDALWAADERMLYLVQVRDKAAIFVGDLVHRRWVRDPEDFANLCLQARNGLIELWNDGNSIVAENSRARLDYWGVLVGEAPPDGSF